MAALNFDATQVEPAKTFDPIPPGKYRVQVVASEVYPTNGDAGPGTQLVVEMDVLDGEHANRKLWDRITLQNPSAQAIEMGARQLSALCYAAGQLHVTDTEVLHFKPLTVTVRIKTAGPDKKGVWREAKNEVKGYEPLSGAAGAGAAPAPRPAGPPPTVSAPPAPKTPPWRQARTAA